VSVSIAAAVLISRAGPPPAPPAEKMPEAKPAEAKPTGPPAAAADRPPPVTAAERKALGTWTTAERGESLTLRDDHSFQMLGNQGDRVRYDFKGEWRIDGETLLLRIKEMTQPNDADDIFGDLGDVKLDVPLTIVSQADNKMMVRTRSGKRVFVYTRF
jgi:hypothetical protein